LAWRGKASAVKKPTAAFLRQEPGEPQAIQEQLVSARAQLDAARGDERETLLCLGRLGEGYRVFGELDAARALLREALELARSREEARAEVVNLIRLATVEQYLSRERGAEAAVRFQEWRRSGSRSGSRRRRRWGRCRIPSTGEDIVDPARLLRCWIGGGPGSPAPPAVQRFQASAP
jgi:hypothetical protein